MSGGHFFREAAAQIFGSGASDHPGVPEDASSLGWGHCRMAADTRKQSGGLFSREAVSTANWARKEPTTAKTDSSDCFGISVTGSLREFLFDVGNGSLDHF